MNILKVKAKKMKIITFLLVCISNITQFLSDLRLINKISCLLTNKSLNVSYYYLL